MASPTMNTLELTTATAQPETDWNKPFTPKMQDAIVVLFAVMCVAYLAKRLVMIWREPATQPQKKPREVNFHLTLINPKEMRDGGA